ncbi:MAG: Gfo/Idh/MocA family oxidoreductase [Kiritimatiellae bacterium]|nr:Gfo/Idh/MocA family oxidoreductase [Kiritimatiellia bacterium]
MKRMPNITRRRFLKVAAAGLAAPAVVPARALGLAGHTAPSNRITLACVGVRGMGLNHLRTLLGLSTVQVAALCDVDRRVLESRLKLAAKGTAGYADFRELVAREDIEAVVIATPDHTHALIALAALESGKDVYVEKPMTLTIREGRAMAEAVRRYGRVLQVGSQRRSSAGYRRMCELVRNGRIGPLHTVDVRFTTRAGSAKPWSPEPVPAWFDHDKWLGPAPWTPYHPSRCHYAFRFVRDYAGGDLTNWGAHYLDIAQWGIGADDGGPVTIEGSGRRNTTGPHDVFHDVNITYTYANGVKLSCRSGPPGIRFVGSDGWISGPDRAEPASVLTARIAPGEVHLPRARGGHMSTFLRCIRSREEPSAPVEVGHRTATVCHLGNIAMALGRPLTWDPAKEEFTGDDEANRMTWRPARSSWPV